MDQRRQARRQLIRIVLRDGDEDAKFMHVGHGEELGGGPAYRHIAPCRVHVAADVGEARGDDSIEGRHHAFECLERRVAREVLPGGLELRLARLGTGRLHVHLLLRDRHRSFEGLPALGGDYRQAIVRLRHPHIGLRRRVLRIQARRVDGREQLARLHGGTVVHVPGVHVPRHLRENGRLVPGAHRAGQHQRTPGRPGRRCNDLDRLDRLRLGNVAELPERVLALDDATDQERRRDNHRQGRDQYCASFHAATPSSVGAAPCTDCFIWCSRANTQGTNIKVEKVATRSPPITARPSAAFCVLDSDIGSMPITIASAVIITGRKRAYPAVTAARAASPWAASSSRAKATTRMEFAVAVPMHMMAPVKAGTERVVCVRNSDQTIPVNAPGSAVMMMNGSSQDWKLTTITRYTSTIEKASPNKSCE